MASTPNWQFVRMATAEEDASLRGREEGSQKGWSLWDREPTGAVLDLDKPKSIGPQRLAWLSPADVMSYGLTDRMRESLGHVQHEPGQPVTAAGPREGTSEATVGPDGAEDPSGDSEAEEGAGEASGIQVLNGQTDKWRWQAIDNPSLGRLWAIDNRPEIQSWCDAQSTGWNPTPAPEFRCLVIEDEVLRLITVQNPIQLEDALERTFGKGDLPEPGPDAYGNAGWGPDD